MGREHRRSVVNIDGVTLPPPIARRAAALRASQPAPAPELGEHADNAVQLAVRMSAPLRAGIHAAARDVGCSTQEWVNRVLRAAVVEASDPQFGLAARLLDELRHEIGDVVSSGAYERFTESLDDPDLIER